MHHLTDYGLLGGAAGHRGVRLVLVARLAVGGPRGLGGGRGLAFRGAERGNKWKERAC